MIEFGTAVERRLKPSCATAVSHDTAVARSTWFQTSRYYRAKVKFLSARQ